MDRLVYVAMTGAKQAMRAMTTVSNNLANVSTTGFRADLRAFSSLPVEGEGLPTRVNAVAESDGWDPRSGNVVATGRDLDIAIKGEGWLAVKQTDGSEAYTRAGDLRVTAAGTIENGEGYLVVGKNGPITLPQFQSIFIGDEGSISIVPIGQDPSTQVEVDRLKLVNPPAEDLAKGPDGLMLMKNGDAVAEDGLVRIATGHLESSNVNAAESLVQMIQLSRQYELQLKAIKSADEQEQASAALLRMQ
ncbi:MAG: flagellar basal body rod protein FlgF [Gammaproteobacteria bacterium]